MTPPSVLITGASTGIGEACALRMAERGWRVFAGVRQPGDGERLDSRGGGRIVSLILEVTDEASIRAAMVQVQAVVGTDGLRGLVNNAGIAVSGPMEYVASAELRRQFEVNVFGLVAVTQAALPLLRPVRGRIVNMASIAGRVTSPLMGPYAASKHAVEAISDALRLELAADGVEVSVIEPGVIRTPIWEKAKSASDAWLAAMPIEGRQRYAWLIKAVTNVVEKQGPRGAPPSVVADAVEHALTAPSPRARYLVGEGVKVRAWLKLLPERWMDRIVLDRLRKFADRS